VWSLVSLGFYCYGARTSWRDPWVAPEGETPRVADATGPRTSFWRFWGRVIGAVGRDWVCWRARRGLGSRGAVKRRHPRVCYLQMPKILAGVSGGARECSEASNSLRSATRIGSLRQLDCPSFAKKSCFTVPKSAL
jgi:hypothetical protein